MVNMDEALGRPIPTPRQVLEVIRAQLRHAAIIGPALDVGIIHEPAPSPDQPPEEPVEMLPARDDMSATEAVFDALVEDALENVSQWASDMASEESTAGMTFDKERMRAFIGSALNECFNGAPSPPVLEVLDLDEGVCEAIGLVIAALARGADYPPPSDAVGWDQRLVGVAACYLGRV